MTESETASLMMMRLIVDRAARAEKECRALKDRENEKQAEKWRTEMQRVNRAMTQAEKISLGIVRLAVERAERAEAEWHRALKDREKVLIREEPELRTLGPTRIARELHFVVSEATIRSAWRRKARQGEEAS